MFDTDGWLMPEAVRLRRLEDGRLELKIHSDVFCDVAVRRTFPVTDPGNYIVVLDARGAEIGIIKTPSLLLPETREVLEDELRGGRLVGAEGDQLGTGPRQRGGQRVGRVPGEEDPVDDVHQRDRPGTEDQWHRNLQQLTHRARPGPVIYGWFTGGCHAADRNGGRLPRNPATCDVIRKRYIQLAIKATAIALRS